MSRKYMLGGLGSRGLRLNEDLKDEKEPNHLPSMLSKKSLRRKHFKTSISAILANEIF